MSGGWTDVVVDAGDVPSVAYRTGLVVYEEALVRGQWVPRAWNAAGFVSAWDGVRHDPSRHPQPQAFDLEIDGQGLSSHWTLTGVDQEEISVGRLATVRLRHAVRSIAVSIQTRLDGTPVITRWLEVTNLGTAPAALAHVAPWSGVLQTVSNWTAHVDDLTTGPFSLGYLASDRWSNEGDFRWMRLPLTNVRIDGRYRRDRHRHPMFVVRNHATGELHIGQLSWSGGYGMEFDVDADPLVGDRSARLWFRVGPAAPAPQRMIDPGETVRTPEVHLGLVMGDLDDGVQAMHDHLRRSVLRRPRPGGGGWVESGIGPEVEITVDGALRQVAAAEAVGAEVFFIDAGWYAPPGGDWWDTVGDWEVDRTRFPDGLGPIRDAIRERGMIFGLWMDAERIGARSATAATHPDWLARAYDGEQRLGGMIELADPVVSQWMEDQICRVIDANELGFFRLDSNVGTLGSGGFRHVAGYLESDFWRYNEALYAIYDRLRARYPNVIFEHCAGGGGRTDIGIVSRFDHTWVTDWQIAPRSFRITNGMTMALPPESVDRLLGGQDGHTTAALDFQARLLLFGRPTVALYRPQGAELNPEQIERIRHAIELYKEVVRPLVNDSRFYHHTPTLEGAEPRGWGVLELASRDRSDAILGVFQLATSEGADLVVRPRGLDPSRRYRVTWDSIGASRQIDGDRLVTDGLRVRPGGPLTSELLLFRAD